MSYARFGTDSDVHVIRTGGAPYGSVPAWECINCRIGKDFETTQPDAMIEHLRRHLIAGHKVPADLFPVFLGLWVEKKSRGEPVVLFRGGYDDPGEPDAITKHFHLVTFRAAVPWSSLVIGRYSVLPFYQELCRDLEFRGSRLINSYTQHRYIADLGNWYRDLRGITPDTWTNVNAVPDEAWPCVLKGETNSKKWQWRDAMFAKDREAGFAVMSRLEQDSMIGDQAIYFRRFVPLRGVGVEAISSGPPISNEFRFFVCDGQVLCGAYYWSCYDRDEITPYPDASTVPRAFLQDVIDRVGKNARFYVVDVAQTQAGDWIVIELNDGQMSGLSDNEPAELYRRLHEVLHDGQR